MPEVSVVVPMYNEAENLPELHSRLSKVLSKLGVAAEIIYVDDGSTDGTAQLLQEFASCEGQAVAVRVVQMPQRRGKTVALAAGLSLARGRVLVTTDADLQEPPEVLPALVAQVQSGEAHLVVAWRQQRRDSMARVLASRLFNAVLRGLTGLALHDVNCGTKAMRREVGDHLRCWMVSDMHRYLPVLAARMGYRVAEVPVPHVARRRGRSRFGASRYLRAVLDLLPVSLLWWRGWMVWSGWVATCVLLVALNKAVGWLGAAFAVMWVGWAVAFWRKCRQA